VLQREANSLRDWERDAQPALFAQQVHYRAEALGDAFLARRAAARLVGMGRPWLALRWRAARESPALERVLAGHTDQLWAAALTPARKRGRRAVSASWDNTLIVWDLDAGRALALVTLEASVSRAAVAPDGVSLVAGDEGGNVYCLEWREPGEG